MRTDLCNGCWGVSSQTPPGQRPTWSETTRPQTETLPPRTDTSWTETTHLASRRQIPVEVGRPYPVDRMTYASKNITFPWGL